MLGSFTQGATGFGFGLIAIGLFSIFLNVRDSLLILNVLTVVLSLHLLWKYHKFIQFKALMAWLLGASLVGRLLAFLFVHNFGDTLWMKKLLGLFLIGMAVYLIWSKRKQGNERKLMFRDHPAFASISGFLAGFIGGSFGVGGPFLVVYFLMLYEDKRHYIANMQLSFVVMGLVTLSAHGIAGDFTAELAWYSAVGIPLVLIGAFAGSKLFHKLPIHRIQQLAYSIVILAGVNTLFFS
jgi:uncharacterized membrane protein YfcA